MKVLATVGVVGRAPTVQTIVVAELLMTEHPILSMVITAAPASRFVQVIVWLYPPKTSP